jgi:hypothetical protein
MDTKGSVRFQVWVPPDFPNQLRKLAATLAAVSGTRVTQGKVLSHLVTWALKVEDEPKEGKP